jgi:predicted Zn-dependent protease
MELMAQQGVQPMEMVGLLEILSKQKGVEVPAFLSTHPVFEERIPEAKAIADQLKVNGKEHLNPSLFQQLKMK